jgi:hypothetical protein
MTYRILIFMSILFINNSSQSMEIIKNKIYKKKHKPTFNLYPHEFFFTQKMIETHNLPQEIITQIRQYCLLARHKNFKNNFTRIDKWQDFLIPTKYQYLLSPQHKTILENLFKTKPIEYSDSTNIYYVLPSKRIYKKFLTLPIEIRRCLVKLPQSKIKNPLMGNYINYQKAIGVTTYEMTHPGFGQIGSTEIIKAKYIIPEDKHKTS